MSSPVSPAGRRVLITGAARGIGAALAEKLAGQGARVALVGLEPDALRQVAERCGPDTFVAECDVSDFEAVSDAVDRAAEALGGLDAVVANAGIAAGGPLRLSDVPTWRRVIDINLLGVMHTDRAALPHLEKSGGYLLNIASAAAVMHGPGMSAYCAAKSAVETLSDCLRVEMAPFGVGVGVAYFLFLDTDMVRDAEKEMPLMERSKSRLPGPFARTYPLAPAVDELVQAIVERRRRVAYPRWFLRLLPLRQLFASALFERAAARDVLESSAEYERVVAERGVTQAGVSERTRELAGL